jgi:DNA polymerase (family 10)
MARWRLAWARRSSRRSPVWPDPLADEGELYAALGLSYIEPELRESEGEVQAAATNSLPVLLTADDRRRWTVDGARRADLDGTERISRAHIAEALSFRRITPERR